MKVPPSVLKVLTNKYVLYFVLFLAVTNVLGYMVMGQFTAALFFIVIAYLISNFSKNMIIVLGAALLLTNILMVGNTVKEGMENNGTDATATDTTATASAAATTATTATTTSNKKQDSTDSTSNNSDVMMNSGVAATNTDTDSKDKAVSTSASTSEPAAKTNDEAMNVMSNKKRNRIDYATTLEDAYGDLNNILGSDGIKKLTEDTQRLMSQQLQLADAMKSMTPLMENAKSMLQGFDLKNLDGLADLAKSFSPSK